MAREKVSNEIIAQVLTQSVSNLEKALEKHHKSLIQVMSSKIQVDATELRKEKSDITANLSDFKQVLNERLGKIEKAEKPLKTANRIVIWTVLAGVLFLVTTILVIYFKTTADEEQKLKAKFVDEVLFTSENKDNFMKLYDRWKNEQTP